MSTFSEQFGDDVMGELTMFDRMVFKGHLSAFFPKGAFKAFLDKQGVLLKGFKDFVQRATADIAKHAETVAERAPRKNERTSHGTRASSILGDCRSGAADKARCLG